MNKGKVKFLIDHVALNPPEVVFKKDQVVELYKESFPPQILFPASQSQVTRFWQRPTPIYHTEWRNGKGSGFYIGGEEVTELEPIRGKWTLRGIQSALSLGNRKNRWIVGGVIVGIVWCVRWVIQKLTVRFH